MSFTFGVPEAVNRMRAALAHKNKKEGRPMTDKGGEILDPTVVAPPVGFTPRESLFDRVREAVRHEQMLLAAERDGKENFFEANDFGPEDDDDEIFPSSRFERMAFDSRSFGRDVSRSKEEQARLAKAENRLARKIGAAVRGELDSDEEPEVPQPRKSSSGARPKGGRLEPPQEASGSEEQD